MKFNAFWEMAAVAGLALALGCAPGEDAAAPDPHGGAGGKADTLDDIRSTADALRSFGDALHNVGSTLSRSEGAIVAVTSGLPMGNFTFRDAVDLDEYRDRVDGVLLRGLVADLDAGREILAGNGEINLDGETLCEAFNVVDEAPEGESTPLERCEALADAANLRLGVEVGDGLLRVELLHGLAREGHPLVFVVDTNDGLALDLEVSMPDADALIDLVEVLSNIDLGDLQEQLVLQGTVRVHFENNPDGVALSIHLPEALALVLGEEFALHAAARGDKPLLELVIDPDGETALNAAIGELSARLRATVANEEAPEGQLVDISWGGLEGTFSGHEDALDFRFSQSPFELAFSGGGLEDYIVSGEILNPVVEGSIRMDGEIERRFEADLEGFETTYALDEDLTIAAEHHGTRAMTTISKDATIVDLLHASSLRKAFFLGVARTRLAFAGDVEEIESIRCVARGRYEVAVEGGPTLEIGPDTEDRCIVGFFTEDDDELHMNYTTMFD